jgi:flagella basal body P-ring formation protein FlgA
MILTLFLLVLGVRVELPVEARVRGAELTLGAIAQVSGDDAAAVERVRAVRLGYSPAPGYSRLIHVSRVVQEAAAQVPDVRLELAGAGACRVWPQTEMVRGAAIEAAARGELTRLLGARDASVEPVQPVLDLQVPGGKAAPEVRARLAAADVGPGQVTVPVQVLVDGAVWRSLLTTWRVELHELRPVLVRDALAGEEIRADMLERRRVTVNGAPALDLDQLVGSTLARPVDAGRALTAEDVVRNVLVQAGSTLFLEVRKGAVNARVPVFAEEPGSRGDVIRVRLLEGERTLRATVVARDLVTIQLGKGS